MKRKSITHFALLFCGAALLMSGCRRDSEPVGQVTATSQPFPKDRNRDRADNRRNGRNAADSNEGNLLLGNPTNARRDPENFLVERPQFTLSYSRERGGPNWVSWHVDSEDLGETDRGKFRPDPKLPADWRITPADYRGSGFDRGHVCPSGDRTKSRSDNDATFYMSNMLPQTGELNRHVWADLESWVRDQVRGGQEAYQIAGGAGLSQRIADEKVAVPEVCWKVVLLLPVGTDDLRRIDATSRVVAVGIPNVKDARLEKGDWRSYITTPNQIEKAANINLFSSLPPTLQKVLKAKKDDGRDALS